MNAIAAVTGGEDRGAAQEARWDRVGCGIMTDMRALTEAYALLCARRMREKNASAWALGERGVAGLASPDYKVETWRRVIAPLPTIKTPAARLRGGCLRANN
ncbi:MAG: hypothetical protein WBD48_12125 [Pseudolabrys sp.]